MTFKDKSKRFKLTSWNDDLSPPDLIARINCILYGFNTNERSTGFSTENDNIIIILCRIGFTNNIKNYMQIFLISRTINLNLFISLFIN